ncbi:hypothetical protein HDU83_001026 [Entophlyctis luteolus]|nr:hypothetical protein HDU83_001026 [Entophlyctis luteolus]
MIECIAWGVPSRNQPETSTGLILLGSKQGHIFEAELQASDDYFKKEEKHFEQVFSIPEDLPVLGIRKVKSTSLPNRYAVIVNTPSRLYQFVGTAFDSSEAGGFSRLFSTADTTASEIASRFIASYLSLLLDYQELPTHGDGALQVWSVQAEGMAAVHKKFGWLTEPGVFFGDFGSLNSQSESVLSNAEIHPLPTDEIPLGIALTEFHFIVLYPKLVIAVSSLNDELLFSEPIPLESNETVLGMVTDEVMETYWVYTNHAIYEVIATDEDRDVWKIYLSRKNYETALTYAKTAVQRDLVITAQAESYFEEKRFRLAATYFAQSSSLSFEEIALRFLALNEIGALKQFLLKKLDSVKQSVSAPFSRNSIDLRNQDLTQMTILSMWLLELFVFELDSSETQMLPSNSSVFADVSAESTPKNQTSAFRQELRQFLVSRKHCIDIEGAFELFLDHGRTEEMLFLAELIGDYERILWYWISEKQWSTVLKILAKQKSEKLFYKFSVVLIEAIPLELVNSWIQHPSLDPKCLLPALLKYESLQSKDSDGVNHAIRYLNHVTNKMDNTDASVHNFLLSLYVSRAHLDNESDLMSFLNSQEDETHYDVQYALRLCIKEELVQSSIFIYSKLGLYEQAVDLSLKKQDLELAQINAEKPVDDDILRKKLWLKIARHVVDESKDIKQLSPGISSIQTTWDLKGFCLRRAISFLKQCDLLRIEDILPFFPDFVLIDNFKSDLCQALEEYNEHIEFLKEEMDEATKSAENIRKDIQNLKNRNVIIKMTEKCRLCSLALLTRQFLVFPCKHVYHADCLTNMLTETIGSSRRAAVAKLKKLALQSKGQEAQNERNMIVQELAAECPLCNEEMIRSVSMPFDGTLDLVFVGFCQ